MKKNGFTLVELLAVIVILAIIALIAVPVILGIINDTKFKKYKIEEGYIKDAAKLYYASKNKEYEKELSLQTLIDNKFIDPVVDMGNGGYCEGKAIEVSDGILKGCLKCSNYVTKGCGYTSDNNEDEPTPEIVDTNPGIICGDKKEEDYDKITECHIRSVEDLVEFSKMVNDNYTFEDKKVYLDKNLDIKDYKKGKSYVNPDALALFDINNDGEITSLKDEMTTDSGFLPIGNSSKIFRGTFEGNAKTIKNLMINRPETDNVGLFGYVSYGVVKGLNVDNINIIGNNNVGGIAGYAFHTDIKEVTVNGNITGNNYVGGVVGNKSSGTVASVIVNVNVTGNKYVYGISHSGLGVVESGTIKGNENVYGGGDSNALVNEKVVIDAPDNQSNLGGTLYKDPTYGYISLYDSLFNKNVLDTYLGGDNDRSGYYFDYDNKGKLVIKSTKENPIDTTLKGEGTKENPYLIYTAEDMKKIAAIPKEENYYKLMNDIDFKDKNYYMIGTGSSSFRGHFEGNAKTIKNINIEGYSNVGLFGYISYGVVKGLNADNINILGQNDNVGGIAGHTYGSGVEIKEVTVNGNITGNNYVGGVVGREELYVAVASVIVNVNVTGNKNVYGISNSGSGVVESGTIKGNEIVYGGVSHGNNFNYSLVNEKVVIDAPSGKGNLGGTLYKNPTYGYINLYDSPVRENVLDTYLGGDNDSSGYYFDYDSKGKLVIKSTSENPINITLQGEGTKENPYLIYTAEDMKQIAAIPKEENYYKLMNDIDFKNKNYYMIGTNSDLFRGNFDGNAKTIKNINIEGYSNVGLFGYLRAGVVKGLNVDNINIIGNNNVGGIAGYTYDADIKEVTVNGNITGNNYVGGVVGYQYSSTVASVIVNVNVTGNSNVYGISAYGLGVVESGIIKGNKNVHGGGNSKSLVNEKVVIDAPDNQGNLGGILFPSSKYNNLREYTLLTKSGNSYQIESPYSGDVNESGYYFDYNDLGTDIIVVKANSTTPINPNINPSNPDESGTPIVVYENIPNKDKSVPECEFTRFDLANKGFKASYNCSDEGAIVQVKHIYWDSETRANYDDLIEWQSFEPSTTISYNSTWTESSAANQGIDPPYPNNCYYFYYGAKNQDGNERVYRTGYCLSY